MTNKDFKVLQSTTKKLHKVFTWQGRLVGVYLDEVYYGRAQLSRKQLASFEFISDGEVCYGN
jgi:hypothetical protein